MQCEITRNGHHLYVDDETRRTCLARPLIECHALYHQICRNVFAAERGAAPAPESDLFDRGFQVLRGCLTEARAMEISAAVSNAVGETDGVLTGIAIDDSLAPLMIEALEATLSEETERLLEAYYASHFRVAHCQLYRTETLGDRHYSFRWHRDVEPMAQLHVMIYFSPSGPEDGGTEFIDFADTGRLAAHGYAFGAFEDRVRELAAALPEGEDPPAPHRPELVAGDAAVFAAPRILHRGIAPKRGHRDVLVLNIMPSLVPWRNTLAEFGTGHLFDSGTSTRNTLMSDPFDPLMAHYPGAETGPITLPRWAMLGAMLPD